MRRVPEFYQYLPLPAKCAIEYLDAQAERSIQKLDKYLEHYFKASGLEVDEFVRYSCHHIAIKRFHLEGEAIAGNILESYIAKLPVWP